MCHLPRKIKNIGLVGDLTGTLNGTGGLSPFNSLNPNDIESISILKDADATSIYGTQGSNGVVFNHHKKKEKPGKTKLNVTVNSGNNYVARPITMLNTSQYIALREEAFKNDGLTPSANANDAGYAPDLTIFNQTKNTNFYKTIFGKTSNNTDAHANLSGGAINNTFILSGGFTQSDYDYPGDFYNKKKSHFIATFIIVLPTIN